MPDLFSPYTLKGVTLRNRIAMSPRLEHIGDISLSGGAGGR